MRLINTRDITFEELIGDSIPQYAIVSHRWGDDEVSYQDFLQGQRKQSYGWTKILKGCQLALDLGYSWLWMDTCCLDKKSSAELTEGINSMFQWYQQSQACLVFLHDVPDIPEDGHGYRTKDFDNSSWFTRGWTLQELIAPRYVHFYNASFNFIAYRVKHGEQISRITGIPPRYLVGHAPDDIHQASISERMSWVAKRHTTRLEDMAYSLLGIFDVNMPLLYGEAKKAFMRLQLEILRKSEDESIFAWFTNDQKWQGLLAPSPQAFVSHSNISFIPGQPSPPFTMTNKGLEMRLEVPESLKLPVYSQGSVAMLLPLNCAETNSAGLKQQLAIRILVKMIGNRALPIFEGQVFRERTRELQLKHVPTFLDKPSEYGCSCIVGMPDKKNKPLKSWTVYFKQHGL